MTHSVEFGDSHLNQHSKKLNDVIRILDMVVYKQKATEGQLENDAGASAPQYFRINAITITNRGWRLKVKTECELVPLF